MEAVVADLAANLEQAERLGHEAGAAGAHWIVLPEFFTTGIGFVPELADAALAPDGEATQLLLALAARHGAWVGGSFLCRDSDGHVRNAFMLASPGGRIAGRHDKDLPTMWENSFYVGGEDAGIVDADGMPVGVALCWELMRTQTVRRVRGRTAGSPLITRDTVAIETAASLATSRIVTIRRSGSGIASGGGVLTGR